MDTIKSKCCTQKNARLHLYRLLFSKPSKQPRGIYKKKIVQVTGSPCSLRLKKAHAAF